MRIAILALLALQGCVYEVYVDEDQVTIDEPFTQVRVDMDAGEVDIVGSDEEGAVIDIRSEYHRVEPVVTIDVVNGVLEIDADCQRPLWHCNVDFDVVVPYDTDIHVTSGAGDVDVTQILGDLTIDTGAGDIGLAEVSGDVSIETGSGRVFGNDLLCTDLFADTGSGRIDLAWAESPHDVDVHTGAGGIDLLVPEGTYDVEADTGAGDVDIDGLTVDDDAPWKIRADTGAGSITITGYNVTDVP